MDGCRFGLHGIVVVRSCMPQCQARKAAVKEVAKENLCEAVELELDREFERMKIPYSRFFGEKKHTKRLSVTEKECLK